MTELQNLKRITSDIRNAMRLEGERHPEKQQDIDFLMKRIPDFKSGYNEK